MTNLHIKLMAVTKGNLKLMFPKARPITIATSAISQKKKMISFWVVNRSGFLPPGTDSVYSELGGIAACAHAYKPLITAKIIDAIRDGHALSIGRKIMIKNAEGGLAPSTAGLVKRSDQFTAFGIDTDYGQAMRGVVLNLGSDVSKLLIPLTCSQKRFRQKRPDLFYCRSALIRNHSR